MISLRGNPRLPRKKKANGLLLNRECVVGKSGDGFTLLRNATTVCSDLSKMCFGMTSPILALSCAAQARGTTQQTAQEGCHSPWPQGPKKMEKPNGPNVDFGKESTLSSALHIICSGC